MDEPRISLVTRAFAESLERHSSGGEPPDLAPYPAFDGTQRCSGTDPEMFISAEHPKHSTTLQAIALCQSCPFIEACLAYAVDHDEWGVWGGTTAAQRAKLVGRRNHQPRVNAVAAIERRRYRQRIAEVDDGTRTIREVAKEVGCTERFVIYIRAERRAAERSEARSDAA